jgi:hypothetical protein
LYVMQRWRESPPEDEGASLSAINDALKRSVGSAPPHETHTRHHNAFRTHRRPPSTSSLDSAESSLSLQSDVSSQSLASSTSQSVRLSKRSRKATKPAKDAATRLFKCTFCCDSFKHKYDWTRHEKSLHLSVEDWQCAPEGGSVVSATTGRAHCVYCDAVDPTVNHLEQHEHEACRNNLSSRRTFRRKDHLVQHLRHFHHMDVIPSIDDWKMEPLRIVSRCGFCDIVLDSWDERADHLAAHFRKGKTMAHWHGDHGFEPAVAARVTYSLAPYLIADDSMSLIPFSATNPASKDHLIQISSHTNASFILPPTVPDLSEVSTFHDVSTPIQQEIDAVTFAQVLTQHLSNFARQQILMGVMPTDEMFQRESRRVMFDDEEDSWNQTLADNQQWLDAFRQKNGCRSNGSEPY